MRQTTLSLTSLPQRHISVQFKTKTLVTRLHFQRSQERPQRRLVSISVRVRYTSVFGTGGASRDRTDDPLLAKQVLSQLSYGPIDGIAMDRLPNNWWV